MAIEQSKIDELKTALRGDLILPGEPGYDEARTIWNGMIDRRPSLVVRCRGVADVVTSVNFARENGVPLSIKGGGHNIAGLSVADGAMMLDMSLMRSVFVDRENKVANAQAGCILGDVDRETQLHGLAAVLGFVSNTGIAGLTLGGGFGYASRMHGWTSDNVISIDVVTADGNVVKASEKENPDLFWALRGGGGNFGVATNFEYKLYEFGPTIYAGGVAWSADDTPKVIDAYRELIEDAPPELCAPLVLRKAPPAPWLSPEIHGKDIAAIFACHCGDPAEGERILSHLKSLGSPVGDILMPRTYVSQQSLLDATQPNGRRYYWKSEYLPQVDQDVFDCAVTHAGKMASPHSAVIVFPLDGAISSKDDAHSAVGNRDARFVVNIAGSWDDASHDDANIGWARSAWEDFRKFSTGGTYLNFLTEDEGEDRTRDALGKNYDRLVDVKTKWDPNNLFRLNKNIAPRG